MSTKYLLNAATTINSRNNEWLIEFCVHASRTLSQLKETHARLLRTQAFECDDLLIRLSTKILELPGNKIFYARQVFNQISHCENQFLWTSLIRAHTLHGQFKSSISFYTKMHREGVYPNGFTFSSVLNACARIPAIREGKQVHTRIIDSGLFDNNKVVQTALLDMYAKCGYAEDARRVFDQMLNRDVVAWTAMISGYAKVGMMSDARALFDVMVERNVVSWTAMVAGYANLGDIEAAKELFDKMPERNSITWTAMIAGYGKAGDVDSAQQVFDEIPKRDESSWAAMIACYAQNGFARDAIEMYKKMRDANVIANEVAVVGVISACTQIGETETADLITDHVEQRMNSNQSLVVSNALIHMHAKCGNIERAWNVFNKMPERDVISYSALITALADHGKAKEALYLFTKMQQDGIKANQVTFVGVLNACSHAGLVEEGLHYFQLMTKTCGIVATREHYACLVDLLGRAGQTCEAYELILENTDEAADAGVWGALLGACRVHGHVELGEIAAAHLFEIEPENTGNYVLLANLYASADRWDDAARIRKMVVERGITKSPGCSWISKGDKSRTSCHQN